MWYERGFFSLIGAISTARPISIQVGKNSVRAYFVQQQGLLKRKKK